MTSLSTTVQPPRSPHVRRRAAPRAVPRRALPLAVVAALLAAALLLAAVPRAAHADVGGTDPAANAVLSSAPRQLSIPVAGATHGVTFTVLDAGRRQVAEERAAVTAGHATARVRAALKPGVYAVVWHAPGARPAAGTFAFSVTGRRSTAATLVDDAAPPAALNPLWLGLPRFFAFALEMTMIGVLALRFGVARPAVREHGDRARASGGAIDRRLLQVAAVCGVLFVPAYLSQLAVESSDPDAGLGFWAMIRPGDIWTYLTTTADGHVWEARLALALAAAALLLGPGLATLRRGWATASRRDERIMALALAAGVAELLARVIPTETPPSWGREIFTQLLDFGHLTSASVWVGGLVGLTILALTVRSITADAPALWGALLRRFSLVATVCVGVMVLTGLWTYWLHVGPPRLLVHTLYGETLLVKLLLVAALLGLGAVNQMWLLPRVQALRASGAGGSALSLTLRHFRLVVAIEAALGLAILFVVPQLAGSARNQSFQDHGGGLTTVASSAGGDVALRRSGLEPGITDYDLTVPAAAGRAVEVTFALPAYGVPPTTVPAIATGRDRYRISGVYTPLVGAWRATVRVAGGPSATISLPVRAQPEDPARAPDPSINASTWIWGAGWVLLVLVLLIGAGVASREQGRRLLRTPASAGAS